MIDPAATAIAAIGEVSSFTARPVERSVLEDILAVATSRATSAVPPAWAILVVEGAERERLVTKLAEALGRYWDLGPMHARGFAAETILAAPTLLLFLARAPSSEEPDVSAAVMAVVQDVRLLACSKGLGTYLTFAPARAPVAVLDFAAAHLGVDAWLGEPLALLALGYGDAVAEARPPVAQGVVFVSHEPESDALEREPFWGEPPSNLAPTGVLRAQRGERVHVVDPHRYHTKLICRRLAEAGYQVQEFANGESLLSHIGDAPLPDLYVVSDALPDMSGFDFVRRLRRQGDGEFTDIPLIVTTARRDSAFRIAGLTAGVDYYLRKPIHPIELYTAVRLLLDRHHLVDELQRATTFQQALLAAMVKVGVLALDETFHLVYMNPGAERMLGYPSADVIGRSPSIFAAEGMPEIPQANANTPSDVRMRRRDGTVFDAELLRFAIRDQKQRLNGYLGVFVDISERKRMERELGAANAEQRRVNAELTRLVDELRRTQARLIQQAKMASLGQLVAGVAHEINTPLGAIVSNNELFERCFGRFRDTALTRALIDTSEGRRDLEAIDALLKVSNTACKRITTIVQELRTFARLDEAETKVVDLHECLESTILLVSHLMKGRITVVRRFGALPLIECHPNQINQVLMNLLTNACQAIDVEGTITLGTRDLGDGRVELTVSDTGPGIPKGAEARVFDPGFTTKRSGVGTGLGLSICYQIIDAHGGEISVENMPGSGARFRVVLPSTQGRDGRVTV